MQAYEMRGGCAKTMEGGVIGEFQIHNNRDCIKFRFYLKFILANTTIDFDSNDFLKETKLKNQCWKNKIKWVNFVIMIMT